MANLSVRIANTWEEVEKYTTPCNTCIRPQGPNWEQAKLSWDEDNPRPVYILIDLERDDDFPIKGYIRLLGAGCIYLSDYMTLRRSDKGPIYDLATREERHNILRKASQLVQAPIAVPDTSYPGTEVKWVGPRPDYKRCISGVYTGASFYLVQPDLVSVPQKDTNK